MDPSNAVVREPTTGVEKISLAGQEIHLTPFCVYKFHEACRLLAAIMERFGIEDLFDAIAKLPKDATPVQAGYIFAPLLPKILRELPDDVFNFLAVCSIPNAKLAELYEEEGGIARLVAETKRNILFLNTTVEALEALRGFLQCLQISDSKNALVRVLEPLQGLMGSPQGQEQRPGQTTGS